MQNVHSTLKFNKTLYKIARRVCAEEIQNKQSTKTSKVRWKSKTISDEQVLQMRALKEFALWKPAKIAEHTGVDIHRVYKILSYEQRSKLIPKVTDLP